MDKIVLIALGISVAGFVFGLAAKARAIKKRKSEKVKFTQKLPQFH